MADNLTRFLARELLDHALAVGAWTMPTAVYLALQNSSPTETGTTAFECTGGAYARQLVTFDAATDADPAATSNNADVTFPQATDNNWGTITHIGVMTHSTTGSMVFHGPLTTQKTVCSGDTFKVPTGDLDITLT